MGERLVRFADWRQRVTDKVTGYKIEVGEPKLKLPSVRPLVASFVEERRQRANAILFPTTTTNFDPNINLTAINGSENPMEDLTTLFVSGEILPFAQRALAAHDNHERFIPTADELKIILSIEEGLKIIDWVKKQAEEKKVNPTTVLPASQNLRVTPQRVLYGAVSLLKASMSVPKDRRALDSMLRGY